LRSKENEEEEMIEIKRVQDYLQPFEVSLTGL